ncbi:MAG: hydrogenase nickel incorporation protein HypB [Chloroflexota bacterium]|nr:hydrogenase nickel incorporation protein HypB [Chloroflexota bacterium]
MQVKVLQNILGANEQIAQRNRGLFRERGIFTLNIMASPGAGKTSVVLETIKRLRDRVGIAVIEGDVASSVDAERIGRENVPVVQINTQGGCHLDANMVSSALEGLPREGIDLIIIENVGNLICPAGFALGEHRRAMIASVPEGDDKPYKYPIMFSEVDVVLLNKVDLLPYSDFDGESFRRGVGALNARAPIIEVSCRTGQGLDEWASWLLSAMDSVRRDEAGG